MFKGIGEKMYVQDNILVISGSREKAKEYFTHPGNHPTADVAGDKMQQLNIYLKNWMTNTRIKTLADIVAFNEANSDKANR